MVSNSFLKTVFPWTPCPSHYRPRLCTPFWVGNIQNKKWWVPLTWNQWLETAHPLWGDEHLTLQELVSSNSHPVNRGKNPGIFRGREGGSLVPRFPGPQKIHGCQTCTVHLLRGMIFGQFPLFQCFSGRWNDIIIEADPGNHSDILCEPTIRCCSLSLERQWVKSYSEIDPYSYLVHPQVRFHEVRGSGSWRYQVVRPFKNPGYWWHLTSEYISHSSSPMLKIGWM